MHTLIQLWKMNFSQMPCHSRMVTTTDISQQTLGKALIVHDVLIKRKEPLDQFVKGLETLGVHQLIKSSPGLMKEHFVNSKGEM